MEGTPGCHLVLPLAPSKIKLKVKASFLETSPSEFCISSKVEIVEPRWTACPGVGSSEGYFYPLHSAGTSVLQHLPVASNPFAKFQ